MTPVNEEVEDGERWKDRTGERRESTETNCQCTQNIFSIISVLLHLLFPSPPLCPPLLHSFSLLYLPPFSHRFNQNLHMNTGYKVHNQLEVSITTVPFPSPTSSSCLTTDSLLPRPAGLFTSSLCILPFYSKPVLISRSHQPVSQPVCQPLS